MKTIIEAYPDLFEYGDFWAPGDYSPLLESFEYEILLKVDDEDYQGDSRLIFRNGDQYGLLIFGWGSCSGCDMLQGCGSIEEMEELRATLHNDIKWDSLEGLLNYINTKDWELDFCWHADETKKFLTQAKELLNSLK